MKITEADLAIIHSYAVQENLNLHSSSKYHRDNQKLLAYCWSRAVTNWLISKGMVNCTLEVDNGIKQE